MAMATNTTAIKIQRAIIIFRIMSVKLKKRIYFETQRYANSRIQPTSLAIISVYSDPCRINISEPTPRHRRTPGRAFAGRGMRGSGTWDGRRRSAGRSTATPAPKKASEESHHQQQQNLPSPNIFLMLINIRNILFFSLLLSSLLLSWF